MLAAVIEGFLLRDICTDKLTLPNRNRPGAASESSGAQIENSTRVSYGSFNQDFHFWEDETQKMVTGETAAPCRQAFTR